MQDYLNQEIQNRLDKARGQIMLLIEKDVLDSKNYLDLALAENAVEHLLVILKDTRKLVLADYQREKRIEGQNK